MQYYSTNHQSPKVSFKEAIIKSEAVDGGLYMPERLPVVPKAFINNMAGMSMNDISFVVNSMLFGDDIQPMTLKRICAEISQTSIPIYEIESGIYVMELFHGPTNTVKDFGAGFLTKIMQELHPDPTAPLNVMIATTGYSGAAIARGFHDNPGVNVFVLYPKGTSKSHLEIINSMGDNIHAIEVKGTIDHCNDLIQKAFEDKELNETLTLTSANSANIGYLLPTLSIYFYAYSQLMALKKRPGDVYMSIPTGNCGNILAAYMAKLAGLPVKELIAACNINGGFHSFLTNGKECAKGHVSKTYTCGMDSPRSANLPRFYELCHGDLDALRRDISSGVCTDQEIADTINEVYDRTGYLLDPHGAAAYRCLKARLPQGATGIFFATAHPSRSIEVLTKVNRGTLKLPFRLNRTYCCRPEASIAPLYPALKKHLKYCEPIKEMLNRG